MYLKTLLVVCVLICSVQVDGALKSVCYTNAGIAASNFNPNICTHIIYSFVQLDASGNIVHIDQSSAFTTNYLANLVALKSQNANLKISVAFGGSSGVSNSVWSSMASNSKSIANFAANVRSFIKDNNIDGVDIDWEYPNSDGASAPADKANFGLLVKQLRTTLGSSYLLSTALGASPWRVEVSYDIPAIFGACDFVNLMTYDFNGWQANGPVGLNAPMYSRPGQDTVDTALNNIDACVTSLLAVSGVDKRKLILGIPTYGHVFALASAANNEVYSAGVPVGYENYNSICLKVNLGQYTSILDNVQQAPYAFAGTTWVGYETPASAAIKAQYIKDKGLGGAMFWSLEADDYLNSCGGGKFPIIATVFNSINGGVITPATTTTTKAATTHAPVVTTQAPVFTTKSSSGTFVCPADGFFKNPTDCNKFYICFHGIANIMACAAGLNFNPAISSCDWPYNVVC